MRCSRVWRSRRIRWLLKKHWKRHCVEVFNEIVSRKGKHIGQIGNVMGDGWDCPDSLQQIVWGDRLKDIFCTKKLRQRRVENCCKSFLCSELVNRANGCGRRPKVSLYYIRNSHYWLSISIDHVEIQTFYIPDSYTAGFYGQTVLLFLFVLQCSVIIKSTCIPIIL